MGTCGPESWRCLNGVFLVCCRYVCNTVYEYKTASPSSKEIIVRYASGSIQATYIHIVFMPSLYRWPWVEWISEEWAGLDWYNYVTCKKNEVRIKYIWSLSFGKQMFLVKCVVHENICLLSKVTYLSTTSHWKYQQSIIKYDLWYFCLNTRCCFAGIIRPLNPWCSANDSPSSALNNQTINYTMLIWSRKRAPYFVT